MTTNTTTDRTITVTRDITSDAVMREPQWAPAPPQPAPLSIPVINPAAINPAAAFNPMVQKYEQRAQDAEQSPYLDLLKVGRIVTWIGWAAVAFNALLLLVAFAFRLGGANTDASFAEWIYRSSDASMRPFRGIFPDHHLGGASVFDASLLFGLMAYVILLLVIDGVNRWLRRKVEAQQHEIAQARATADSVALQFEQQQQQQIAAATAAAAAAGR